MGTQTGLSGWISVVLLGSAQRWVVQVFLWSGADFFVGEEVIGGC